jgi:hypothetical protein
MSHDDTIRSSAYSALKAQGFRFTWRSITKGAYDPDSLSYGTDTEINHEVVGAVYTPVTEGVKSTGAEAAEKGASSVHHEKVEAAFPVPPDGLGFTPAVGDRILFGGDEWRVIWIIPVKGVAEVVAYQAGAVHG